MPSVLATVMLSDVEGLSVVYFCEDVLGEGTSELVAAVVRRNRTGREARGGLGATVVKRFRQFSHKLGMRYGVKVLCDSAAVRACNNFGLGAAHEASYDAARREVHLHGRVYPTMSHIGALVLLVDADGDDVAGSHVAVRIVPAPPACTGLVGRMESAPADAPTQAEAIREAHATWTAALRTDAHVNAFLAGG